MQYLNLDLRIINDGGVYRSRVASQMGGEATSAFLLPFVEMDATQFFSQIQTAAAEDIQDFGTQLFDALFTAQSRDLYQRSCSLAQTQNARLRIRLNLTEVPELTRIPWEYLYDSTQNRFLALSVETTFVRYLDLLQTAEPLVVQPPLRILVVISNPGDFEPLAVEQEWQSLNTSVADLASDGLVDLQRLDRATLAELQRTLRRSQVHILHFIGHGFFDQQSQSGLLVFEDEEEQSVLVSGEQLGTILDNHPSLRLAVLNACAGGQSSESDAFSGVAQRLVHKGIPAVIAMQDAVTDTAATVFSYEFYAAVADAYPVDSAVAEARVAMAAQGNSGEWGIPILYMRTADGSIFAPKVDDKVGTGGTTMRWHAVGTAMVGAGLLGFVLLAGLGAILLQGNPVLQTAIAAMVGLATFLLGFLGLQGDKTLLPKLSHWVGQRRSAQIMMGCLLAVGLAGWATIGLDAWQQGGCDPVLGCKEAGQKWFAVDDWQLLVEDPSPFETILTAKMRDVLYQKFSLVDTLKRVGTDSSQMSEAVLKNLDLLIAGDYQRLGIPQLSASIRDPGGQLYEKVTVSGDPDVIRSQSDTCLLEMQHRLAVEILVKLDIEVPDAVYDSMRKVPTVSCEALRLNFEGAQEFQAGGSLTLAQTKFEQALDLDPNYADAHNNLGRILELEGDVARAIDEYETAIEIQDGFPLYYFNLGNGYQKLAYPEPLLEPQPVMASLDPDAQGSLRSAVEAYHTALDQDPVYTKTLNNLGYTYLLMDELDAAQEALNHGIALDPDVPVLHKNLGVLHLMQREPEEAVQALDRAIDLFADGVYAEALYFLSLAQWELEQKETACTTLLSYAMIANLDVLERADRAEALFAEWQCGQ